MTTTTAPNRPTFDLVAAVNSMGNRMIGLPDMSKREPLRPARRMHHHELPDDFLSAVLPTARPVRVVKNGKESKRWQAVCLMQGAASNPVVFIWSSSDLYESRDEAQEVAVLTAERFEVADYLDSQGADSLPVN